ncbi:tRNA (adenosine(37)-N6)-threonylcarbamoyltransferase complex dimerization subunit type 1 TsaB [PVC group bacterium]|nr:tRNA (adenosine(37)-N6)-threonylcarbamoyltransferase complex dimerization subunit type 1 TsaB [PVC group bacterium]
MGVNSIQTLSLSLELAQQDGSVAARLGSGKIIELPVMQGDRSKDTVMPAVDNVISLVGGTPNNINTVVVSIGPGGFTGLRIAVATAKMISFATGASIVPVETALGVVQSSNDTPNTSLVVSCVKKDNFWLSVVGKDPRWSCSSRLICDDEFEEHLDSKSVLFGDQFLPEQIRLTCEKLGVEVRPAVSNATSIMEVGIELLKAGKTVDPIALLPLYPREAEAVRRWQENK